MVIFPYTLSLVFCGGVVLLGALLLLVAWRTRAATAGVPADLPVDASRYGPEQTNRWLKLIRAAFVLLCAAALGLHAYWVFWAPDQDDFARFAVRDQRNRRLAESSEGHRRIQELAEEVHLSQSALSRLVQRLQDEGLVTRKTCDYDRRGIFACVTDAGRKAQEEAHPTHRAVIAETLGKPTSPPWAQ